MIRSVCLLRLSAIGDVTHAIPVVLSLQRQVPGVEITWIIGALESRLVDGLAGVEFLVLDKKHGWRAYRNLYRQLGNRRFDVLLHMQVAMRANLASTLVRAERRIGYDAARSKDLHRLFINERIRPGGEQHVRDCFASFLEPLGLAAAPPCWEIPLAESDYEFAREHLSADRVNVVISPCSSHELRNWRAGRYAVVADHAIRSHGAQVTFVGSPSPFEQAFVREIESHMRERAVNLVGKDTLKKLAALLAAADLVVAPDTGPAHFASALGTDVLGLYAASNPHRSGPYGSIQWCVNRYPDAALKFLGKPADEFAWGTKIEFAGVMDLISTEETVALMDRWFAAREGSDRESR